MIETFNLLRVRLIAATFSLFLLTAATVFPSVVKIFIRTFALSENRYSSF